MRKLKFLSYVVCLGLIVSACERVPDNESKAQNVSTNKDCGCEIDVHFSKTPTIEKAVVDFIRGAEHKLDFALYTLTYQSFSDVISEEKQKGRAVRMIIDDRNSKSDDVIAQLTFLQNFKIPIKVDNGGGTMHLKRVIRDRPGDKTYAMMTGSMNWSNNGLNKNDET